MSYVRARHTAHPIDMRAAIENEREVGEQFVIGENFHQALILFSLLKIFGVEFMRQHKESKEKKTLYKFSANC